MKFDYEKTLARRKEVAQIIFDNAFMSGLPKLKRSDLYDIIFVLQSAYSAQINENYYEEDVKVTAFEDKCNLCELLDEDFFTRGTDDNKGID